MQKEEKKLLQLLDERKKYEFYISESEKSAKNSDKIIVISDAQKEKFISLFPYAADKVELLENGYDPKTFYVDKNISKEEVISELKSQNTPDGKIDTDFDNLILFVGKFADFKGIDSLLNAAKLYEEELKKQGKKPLTIIVGSGALEGKLKEQYNNLQLENVHFVGRQSHDVIRKLQNIATVSLIPSRDEPFGLVVIEGTACGHPVIGSNSGGIPGILNNKKEKLPNQDIIKTDLGLLIKPLPVRPESLNETQKDVLDAFTTKYMLADAEGKKEIIQGAKSEFADVSNETLRTYFEEYEASTRALSDSVVGICDGKYKFDNDMIAEYTKKNYSQESIREKLINLFKNAIRMFSRSK